MWPQLEPGSVVEHWEGGLVTGVVAQKVFGQHSLDTVHILFICAAIQHGALTSPGILHVGHGDLPHTWVGPGGAGWN